MHNDSDGADCDRCLEGGRYRSNQIRPSSTACHWAGAAVVQQVDKGDELRILGSSEDKDSGQTFGKVWQDGAETDLWVNVEDINKIEGIAKTSMAFGEKFAWFSKAFSYSCITVRFSRR